MKDKTKLYKILDYLKFVPDFSKKKRKHLIFSDIIIDNKVIISKNNYKWKLENLILFFNVIEYIEYNGNIKVIILRKEKTQMIDIENIFYSLTTILGLDEDKKGFLNKEDNPSRNNYNSRSWRLTQETGEDSAWIFLENHKSNCKIQLQNFDWKNLFPS